MNVVKQLKAINFFGDVSAIAGVVISIIYILLSIINDSKKINDISILNYFPLIIIVCLACLCTIKTLKVLYDYKKRKRMMKKSYLYVKAKEMSISAYPKSKAIYTITGYYSIDGATYKYTCKIEDGFHLITDYMISVNENGELPDMRVYIDTSDYEQYYISPYEYMEKLVRTI